MVARRRSSTALRSILLTLTCFCFFTLLTSRSKACSCGPNTEHRRGNEKEGVWNDYTVFYGRSLEVRFDESGANMAVRYRVESSNRLTPGDEAIVFRATSSATCGGGTHAAGTSGVVVAENRDGVLHTDLCSRIFSRDRPSVLEKLGLPQDFFEQEAKRLQTTTPRPRPVGCQQPTTLAAAFSRSSAVIKPWLNNSCWNEERQMVETVAKAHISFKGAPDDEWFILFHPPDESGGRGEMHRPVYEATRTTWPPALFLRREGSSPKRVYIHDRCLDPVFPADSGEQAINDIRKYLQYPADWSSNDPKNAKPALSCSTLNDDIVNKGQAALVAFQQRYFDEYQRAKSETASSPKESEPNPSSPRQGNRAPHAEQPLAPREERPQTGCAGCTIPVAWGTSHRALLGLLLLLLVAARRRSAAP